MNRRSFLLGTSAALALAAAPKLVTAFEPVILPDSTDVVSRSMYELTASAGKSWPGQARHALTIGQVDNPVMNFGMGPGGILRWVAVPGNELILKRDQDLLGLIDWWPPPQEGCITFTLRDTYADGGYMLMSQRFDFIGLERVIALAPTPLYFERLYPYGHPKHVPIRSTLDDYDDEHDEYDD